MTSLAAEARSGSPAVASGLVELPNFVGVRQAQSEWCWAAAAASIYNYFAVHAEPPRDKRSQCFFVDRQFRGIGACFKENTPGDCTTRRCFNPAANKPGHLNYELQLDGLLTAQINCDGTDQMGHWDLKLHHGGFDALEIKAAIDGGCPIALRLLLRVENGQPISHFLVIVGYDLASLDFFKIWDPNRGFRYLSLEELVFSYGPLEQKYLTQQSPPRPSPNVLNNTNKQSPTSLDYEVDITHPTAIGDDVNYGAMTFLRNNNPNGLVPTLHFDGDGPWLRLGVVKDAFTGATAGSPDINDRCELRDEKIPLGTALWYSFDIRAEDGFPAVDARCVCAQIKAPYYDADGGSPLFALRIDRGRYVATVEHLYETKDVTFVGGSEISSHVTPYQSADLCQDAIRAFDHHIFGNSKADFKELQVRVLLATDRGGLPAHLENEFLSCTDLVHVHHGHPLPDNIFTWWRFIVRVAPTRVKDEDGVLELAIVDPTDGVERLIARATGEFGHAGDLNPASNTGPVPGQGLQYFKIGPYRDKWKIWGAAPAAIQVRNIKRGYWARGAELREHLAKR